MLGVKAAGEEAPTRYALEHWSDAMQRRDFAQRRKCALGLLTYFAVWSVRELSHNGIKSVSSRQIAGVRTDGIMC